jgi:histidinol-phosphate phosphatase family protein
MPTFFGPDAVGRDQRLDSRKNSGVMIFTNPKLSDYIRKRNWRVLFYENSRLMSQVRYSALFLDRDGVINERLPGAYVSDWEQFSWCAGNPKAIVDLGQLFQYVFVVTNQQGVGKGLMTQTQLDAVHQRMQQEITARGGRIDQIFYCTDLAKLPGNCRKPSPQMGYAAQSAFPDIDFSRSFMVGDSLSDLQFGQTLGMKNVWVRGKAEEATVIRRSVKTGLNVQYEVDGLADFLVLLS